MKPIETLLQFEQYSLEKEAKSRLLLQALDDLTKTHKVRCKDYGNIINSLYSESNKSQSLADVPYIPVSLFKTTKLQSVKDSEIIKTLTSSGTTSQAVSKIYLDKQTSVYQTRVLASIMTSFIGKKRLPMIFIDSDAIIKNRKMYSARGAGLTGLSIFGRDHFYALNDKMEINIDGLIEYIKKYENKEVLIFGFTYMIWQYFYEELKRKKVDINLENAILIHSGGWKKLQEKSISNEVFKKKLNQLIGIKKVHAFYGMVEQVGSIFMECEMGYLHAPNFSDILVRDFRTWEILPINYKGVVQTLSILPHSYPGHSLLTEDVGVINGIDNCLCGRKGSYFTVEGRIPRAELRGCSDTHAEEANSR
jgi:phenylacetate-coenzyme A ligase PaaK-like adenylate-forming protein